MIILGLLLDFPKEQIFSLDRTLPTILDKLSDFMEQWSLTAKFRGKATPAVLAVWIGFGPLLEVIASQRHCLGFC